MDRYDWRVIKSTPLFGAMSEEAARSIIGEHGARAYSKGTVLFHQGDEASAFYLILSGWVKISRITSEGEEAVCGIFTKGETFAEFAMLLGGRYPAGAEVIAPSRLLKIDGKLLRRKIQESPELALSMLASASRHLKLLVEQIEQIKLRSAPRRIAEFLVGLSAGQGVGSCTLNLPYEKALIASRLGMQPESFSRALKRLKSIGVEVRGDDVTIANVAALAAYVETGDEPGL
jgi:CRP/FNR family transcriptional regulator, dissimilatory nitrate respiration regulator